MHCKTVIHLFLFLFVCMFAVCAAEEDRVRMWEEPLVLPTYQVNVDEVNPMFRRPLSYQGASRVIYPYPLQDNLTNNLQDQTYKALYLENEYIKLCILPELGGRLFYATDKTNGYEIFYRQHVIKPSHIGMLGAWISGGIEWCVFHHHRASTYLPVNYSLQENEDGSKTIWIGEIEPRHRMKWSIGISLHPGQSIIEAKIRMFNRTDTINSILYWANVATHVNDEYQIFFPPSSDFGVFHAKNEFVHWPIAQDRYRGVDYEGVDLSWWKNHPNPVSIFAHDLQEGFLAGYDHGQEAGVVHVGNPHIVTGSKLWEWGPGEEGSMWDTKVLTDADGPYAELMAGAYSDNQPDYSWIKPYEMKEATQYWYPLRDMGGVKSANPQASINLEIDENDDVFLALNTTQAYRNARVKLTADEKIIFEETIEISPANPYSKQIAIPDGLENSSIRGALYTDSGQQLVAYQPVSDTGIKDLPETVTPPADPKDIDTVEELYLTGLRIKQFHNARLDPNEYFKEALRRDPNHSKTNIQMGLDSAQNGLFEEAEAYFQTAVDRISKNYTRPRDCEAYYQLGLVQKKRGNLSAAYDHLYRAAWDYEFRSAAYYNLAEIDCLRGDFKTALHHINESLAVNTQNTKALGIESAILRTLGQTNDALRSARQALKIDPLDFLSNHELVLLMDLSGKEKRAEKQLDSFTQLLKGDPESYLELAVDYMNAGFLQESNDVLSRAVEMDVGGLSHYPTIHYYLAALQSRLGNQDLAAKHWRTAQQCPTDYCFPFRWESIDVFQQAIENNPNDSRAYYYLGNLLYDRQPQKAIEWWKMAVEYEPTLAIAHRNLGWGYFYEQNDLSKAIASYERAIKHNPQDPQYYYELDRLHERNGTPVDERLRVLEENHEYVKTKESSLTREIIVLVHAGKYDKAIKYLDNNFFHIQEGNRRLHDTHVDAHLLRGLKYFHQGKYQKALEDFQIADTYPENHQVGRTGDYERNPQIYYFTGLAAKKLGDTEQAERFFAKAVEQELRGRNDRLYRYYQASAHRELGHAGKAEELFGALVDSGKEALQSADETDFFAKFGEGDPKNVRQSNAHYMMGLGYLGLGKIERAKEALQQAVTLDVNNTWANYHLNQL